MSRVPSWAIEAVKASPKLERGQVWCRSCGRSEKVDAAACLAHSGWPECCGSTMTVDSPEERKGATP